MLSSFMLKKSSLRYRQKQNFYILSKKFKQIKSIKHQNCFVTHEPWYTYPCQEYLNSLDMKKYCILEYGSGSSTIYFSKRCKSVKSIEHNEDYFNFIKKKNAKNVEIFLKKKKDEYINYLYPINYDIIVIDGEHRSEIAKKALENSKQVKDKVSIIIFDNSDWFPQAIDNLMKLNFIRVDFSGIGPINNYSWTTSMFFNQKKRTKFLNHNKIQPIAGLKTTLD